MQDYGGMLSSLDKYHNEQRRMLETDYRDWLLETNQFKELPKDAASNNNDYSATNQNTSRSSGQQKTPEPTRQKYKSAKRGLKNLEID